MNQTGYQIGGSTSAGAQTGASEGQQQFWPLDKCKKAYLDYLGNKQAEIDEQKDARRYYHGAQWTAEQVKALTGSQIAAIEVGDIQAMGGVEKIGEFIKQVKDKNSQVKLMGFGHRVYKNYDPRAKLMRETCHEVLGALGLHDDPLFKLAMALEKIALEDDYFVSRKLYPNVDFYSGIVQRAIGIPVSLFTAIFALARTVGWIAQLNEMIGDPEYKIGRPRQLFVGSVRRDVTPIAQR